MNTLLEVKHKLKTQDLFRASTVKAMVEQCETLTAENAALHEKVQRLEAERDMWRSAMQSMTPGGSEFTEPKGCVAFAKEHNEQQFNTLKRMKLERDRLEVVCHEARKALAAYQEYRRMNTLNFQLEKADSYIHNIAAALDGAK